MQHGAHELTAQANPLAGLVHIEIQHTQRRDLAVRSRLLLPGAPDVRSAATCYTLAASPCQVAPLLANACLHRNTVGRRCSGRGAHGSDEQLFVAHFQQPLDLWLEGGRLDPAQKGLQADTEASQEHGVRYRYLCGARHCGGREVQGMPAASHAGHVCYHCSQALQYGKCHPR